MKVSELIEKLKQYDGDLPVVVDGYEGGVTECFDISSVKIKRGVHDEWYYGESEVSSAENAIEVVYISREDLSLNRS